MFEFTPDAHCEEYVTNRKRAINKSTDKGQSFDYGHLTGELAAYNHIYEYLHDRISQLCEDDSSAAAFICSELCDHLEATWNLIEACEDVKSDFFEVRHNPDPDPNPDPLPDLKPMQEWLESEDKWLEEQEAKLKDNGGH